MSEALADTEEEVEVVALSHIRGLTVVVLNDRIDGRIQVIAEVKSYLYKCPGRVDENAENLETCPKDFEIHCPCHGTGQS